MTRTDIEAMLTELAATTRDLHESGRLLRHSVEHLVAVGELLQRISQRTEAAMTAGLTHLHGQDEGTAP